MNVAALRSLWPWSSKPDPYADFFLNARPADPRNLIVNRIREAPEGSPFAVKAETHTSEVMAHHIKELGRFFGTDLVSIVDAAALRQPLPSPDGEGLPYAILCGFRAEHDPRETPGIGGHVAALKGAFATFQLSAIIREYGFRATRLSDLDSEQAAVSAGIGTITEAGRLTVPGFGINIHIADVILTDLPVELDRQPARRNR